MSFSERSSASAPGLQRRFARILQKTRASRIGGNDHLALALFMPWEAQHHKMSSTQTHSTPVRKQGC
jgi:hypothetical protein